MSEPTDFPPIMTARLLLRPHQLEDAAVLSALSDDPEQINTDPYGDGWIVRMQPSGEGDTMGPDEYQALLDELDD